MSTGVMHQIRIHAKHSGIPLAFDSIYHQNRNESNVYNFRLHHIGIFVNKTNEEKQSFTSSLGLPSWVIEKNFKKQHILKSELKSLKNLILDEWVYFMKLEPKTIIIIKEVLAFESKII